MTDQEIREHRLMVFTSLIRTVNFVSHARIRQCYSLFNQYTKEYPLVDGYASTEESIDHANMKLFISKLTPNLINKKPDWISDDVTLPLTSRITVESDDPRLKEKT